jgi:hypothetical protein
MLTNIYASKSIRTCNSSIQVMDHLFPNPLKDEVMGKLNDNLNL